MGRRDRQELVSRLKILLDHLLKWQYRPAHRSGSWRGFILEQRLRIRDLLEDCPSLQPFLAEASMAGMAMASDWRAGKPVSRSGTSTRPCLIDMALIFIDP